MISVIAILPGVIQRSDSLGIRVLGQWDRLMSSIQLSLFLSIGNPNSIVLVLSSHRPIKVVNGAVGVSAAISSSIH